MRPTSDERRALEDNFRTFAQEIVSEFPGQWALDLLSERISHLATAEAVAVDGLPQGLRIHIRLNAYECRICASPSVPPRNGSTVGLRDWGVIGYNDSGPACTVDAKRPVKAIAKDIARKVILPYAPLYAKIVAQRDTDTATHNATKALLVDLSASLGRVAVVHGDHRRDPYAAIDEAKSVSLDVRGIGDAYGHFTVHPYGTCQLEIRSLSGDHARKIAAFLATLQTAKG